MANKEAIELEKALEVLFWCQENADEKWMVEELAATFVGLPEGSIGGQAMKKANAAMAKPKKEGRE